MQPRANLGCEERRLGFHRPESHSEDLALSLGDREGLTPRTTNAHRRQAANTHMLIRPFVESRPSQLTYAYIWIKSSLKSP